MNFRFEQWPFVLPSDRLPDEDERWWAECYVPPPQQQIIESRSQWCMILGKPQSGKTTLLTALRRQGQDKALILQEEISRSTLKKEPSENFLQRLLSQASQALRQDILAHPEKITLLSKTQREFLRWSIEKFRGYRSFARLLDGLPEKASKSLSCIPFEDIYPSQDVDVEGQIEELINLVCKIGYTEILITVDTHPFAEDEILDRLIGWLEPMQHDGLKAIVALPFGYNKRKVQVLTRGRASIFQIESSPSQNHLIIQNYLRAATEGDVQTLEELCDVNIAAFAEQIIEDVFTFPTIGGWIKMLEILLEMRARPEKQISEGQIQAEFYSRFAPLRMIGKIPGVWRGYKWIPLENALYEFLRILFSHQKQYVDHRLVPTSKGNLHTLARRLRLEIEPNPAETIYLKNIKGEGYWLDHIETA